MTGSSCVRPLTPGPAPVGDNVYYASQPSYAAMIIVLRALLVPLVALFNGSCNALVGTRSSCLNAVAHIEDPRPPRYDLIPNLVEAAKDCLKQERETPEAVVVTRSAAVAGRRAADAKPKAREDSKVSFG